MSQPSYNPDYKPPSANYQQYNNNAPTYGTPVYNPQQPQQQQQQSYNNNYKPSPPPQQSQPQVMNMGQAQPLIVMQQQFGENPVQIQCPNCHNTVLTSVTRELGTVGWIIVIVLLFICLPCAWIPCVVDGCKDAIHRCPVCRVELGRKTM